MSLETGLALAAGFLLLVATVAQALPSSLAFGRQRLVIPAARAAAACFLAAALVAGATATGSLVTPDRHQLALALALAILVVQAYLNWRAGACFAGPASDLSGLVLVLLGAGIVPLGPPQGCAPQPLSVYIQSALYLLGAGGAIVAACAALMFVVRASAGRPDEGIHDQSRIATHTYLQRGSGLSLLMLGAGLVYDAWLTSREVGRFVRGDARQLWMIVAWLLVAASLLAWRQERQSRRRAESWAVSLALLAASAAVLGLFVANELGMVVGL